MRRGFGSTLRPRLLIIAGAAALCAPAFGQGPSFSPSSGIKRIQLTCGLLGVGSAPTIITPPSGIIGRATLPNVQSGASYAIATTDCGVTVNLTAASATPTIPAAGSAGFPNGWFTDLLCTGAGGCTLTPASGTINGLANLVLQQYQSSRIEATSTAGVYIALLGATTSSVTGGGGITVYAGSTGVISSGATTYFPIGGGGSPNSNEPIIGAFAPATATVSNFGANISVALGTGISIAFTWRDATVSQSLTCTISGATATSCQDLTHSFTATKGDFIDIQAVVTGGAIGVSKVLVMTAQFGTVGTGGGTVNQNIRTIGASFGSFQSGATTLTTAATACVPTYISGTIQAVEILGNVSGSATIDVQTVAHASWTGTASVASITASDIPALSSSAVYTDTTLTGWNKTVLAGTDVCFVMSSPTTVAGLSITLKVAAN